MPNENAVQAVLSSTPSRTCGLDQDSGAAFVLDQRHDTGPEIPAMIGSALNVREATAKAPPDEAPPGAATWESSSPNDRAERGRPRHA
ncbi:hypothetical protein [Actinopolyspora halophila]|uniref:hypothetical protein n=1 Tax=Actinopolyspora halophila TaxID=1850 RepID=UPI0003627C97|nr:hypothetical protein [Actinopolyspora halophila]